MKYLKTYEAQHVSTIANRFKSEYSKINTKLFEIEEYIKDILIALTHEGYEVKTNVCTNIADNHINLSISNRNSFQLSDIKDELTHLNNYLKSKGIESPIPSMFKYGIGSVKSLNSVDYETHKQYKSYEFFCRLYPKKVKELRAKIDAIRNPTN